MKPPSNLRRKDAAVMLMVASGFAGLGYQIVWTQQCALWLGHESVETSQMYLHADLRLKEQALSRLEPLGVRPSRYRPEDQLLRFLESL